MLGSCAAAYILTSSGYWSKTPYGTKNVSKTEADSVIKSWLSYESYESVKRVDGWDAKLAKLLTQGLEIMPLDDPLKVRRGDKLPLLLTLAGRPARGVVVAYDGKPRGQSGANGTLNIRIRHGGFQLLQASLTLPSASTQADEVIHCANLNFELPQN